MSSRYSKEDKEHKSGRDRSRSRSPKARDNDNSKRKDRDYDKRDNNYKNDQRETDDINKKQSLKLPESYSLKLPKPIEQKITISNEEKKTSFAIAPKSKLKMPSIQMKIGGSASKPKLSAASAFNEDSDEEPEEMPPEARMRMKNIGRNTPTSSGPNSFGKTKQGFSDAKKIFERNLKEAMDAARADD